MTITPTTLTRGAAAAAVAAGAIFIGVQINHPTMDADSITTTEVVVRNSLKVLMAVLALVGITGIYLRQVKQSGVLGLIGYVVLSACYLVMLATLFNAAFVLPTIADTSPGYVNDAIAVGKGENPAGDVGFLQTAQQVQSITFLAGGLIFGIALYRARVLARWASGLLALGGVIVILLSVMPDAFYRLLAFPNGIAMIGLGYSLWATSRAAATDTTSDAATYGGSRVAPAGA